MKQAAQWALHCSPPRPLRFEEPAIQSARQSPESPWQSRPQPQLCYSLGRFVDRPHRSPHPSWQTAPPRRRQRPASAGPVRPSRKTSTVGDRRAPDMAPKVSFLQRIEAASTPGTGVEPRLPRSPQGSPRSSMRARSQPHSPRAALGRGSRFYSAGVSTSPVSAAGSSVQSALRPSQRSERPRPYKDVPFPASRPRQPGAPKHGKLHAATAHAAAPLRSYHTTRRQYTRGGMSNQRALPAALAPRLLSRGRAEQGHFNRVHGGSGWE